MSEAAPAPPLLRHNADDLFNLLFASVGAHEATLQRLSAQAADTLRPRELAAAAELLSARQDQTTEAVAALEAAVAVDGGRVGAPAVGAAAAANRAALEDIAAEVAKKSDARAMAARLQHLEAELRLEVRGVREGAASSATAAALETSCAALNERCGGLEQAVERCLSRADAKLLLAAAERLRGFDDFVARSEARMAGLEAARTEQATRLATLSEDNLRLRGVLEEVLETLERKGDRTELQAMRESLESTRVAVRERTLRRDHEELVEEVVKARRGLGKLSQGLQKTLETVHLQGAALHNLEADKASRSELDESVATLRASVGAVQAALQRSIAERCTVGEADAIREDLAGLTAALAKTNQAAQLGMKFVDWFSSRGQAYEHNLGALDRHLKNLVLSSARPGTQNQEAEDSGILGQRFRPFADGLSEDPVAAGTIFTFE